MERKQSEDAFDWTDAPGEPDVAGAPGEFVGPEPGSPDDTPPGDDEPPADGD